MPIETFRLVLRAVLCTSISAWAQQFTQQGPKLVGSGSSLGASQGFSVALSADGNTALVGSNGAGAWVFVRSISGYWTQQGSTLVGSGSSTGAGQGFSVALSADGNTALVGSNGAGAWAFVRDSRGNWTQQGSNLLGSGASSVALSADGNTALVGDGEPGGGAVAVVLTRDSGGAWHQQSALLGSGGVDTFGVNGYYTPLAVAISADGNTALMGNADDNNGAGAAWGFARDSSGNWTQQGTKLIGGGAVNPAAQGNSVAMSADGNTALIGGPLDQAVDYTQPALCATVSCSVGAVWVFTRDSNSNWHQQGNKLVGNGEVQQGYPGGGGQGSSVALSADGNTAIFGASGDNNSLGAAWIFTRDGLGNWKQQESKLVGSGAAGQALGFQGVYQGGSVALSGEATTAIVGGEGDNAYTGAVWVFARPACRTNVILEVVAGQYMQASFTPPPILGNPNPSLLEYASYCDFTSFDWQQQITVLPAGNYAVQPTNPIPLIASGNVVYLDTIAAPADGHCVSDWTNCSLIAPPPFADPPQGGYSYQPGFNPYPFYYPLLNFFAYPDLYCTTLSGGCPPFPYQVSSDGKTLSFVDHPINQMLPNSPVLGQFQGFNTALVGVDATENAHPLYTWAWNTTYNGTTGTVSITSVKSLASTACDVTNNGAVDVEDVQSIVNQSLGLSRAVNHLTGDGKVGVVDLQIVINAALGLGCLAP